MKKLLPVAGLLLLPLIVSAKTGFFLKPAIGVGVTNTQSKNFLVPIEGKNILSTEYELSAGFQAGRIGISAGIGYLTTGYKEKRTIATAFDVYLNPVSFETITMKAAFRHLVVPVHISYTIPFNKLSLVPEAGVDGMYNLGVRGSTDGLGVKSSRFISGSDFHDTYTKFSLLAVAQLNIQFHVTHSISVYGGPGSKYMLTNLVNKEKSAILGAQLHNYTMLIHAGLIYRL